MYFEGKLGSWEAGCYG